MTVRELIDEYSHSAFGARVVSRACRLAQAWARNDKVRTILSVSGAVSIAQQDSLIAELIRQRKVHALVTTGAAITHSLTADLGGERRPVREGETDDILASLGMNRVFDTVESDANLERLDLLVSKWAPPLTGHVGSNRILSALGRDTAIPRTGLLGSASSNGVPVFVPALSDSELGLRLASHRTEHWTYDAFADLEDYRHWIEGGGDCVVLTLGGGVPRNWTQQMFSEISLSQQQPSKLVGGIRVCPDTVLLGHLSGSTFEEARSWRKIDKYDSSQFIEINADYTLIFPLLALAMLD